MAARRVRAQPPSTHSAGKSTGGEGAALALSVTPDSQSVSLGSNLEQLHKADELTVTGLGDPVGTRIPRLGEPVPPRVHARRDPSPGEPFRTVQVRFTGQGAMRRTPAPQDSARESDPEPKACTVEPRPVRLRRRRHRSSEHGWMSSPVRSRPAQRRGQYGTMVAIGFGWIIPNRK